MEGLKQQCSAKLRQASQNLEKSHQALQLQVCQLQVSSHLTPVSLFIVSILPNEKPMKNIFFVLLPKYLKKKKKTCVGWQQETSGRGLKADPRQGACWAQAEVLWKGEHPACTHTWGNTVGGELKLKLHFWLQNLQDNWNFEYHSH